MTRRRLFLLGSVGVAVAAAVIVALAVRPPRHPIRAANLDRIRPGMARAEVEELLGGPPGDYRTRDFLYEGAAVVLPRGQPGQATLKMDGADFWRGDELMIAVHFDRAGAVEYAFGLRPLDRPSWRQQWKRRLPFLP